MVPNDEDTTIDYFCPAFLSYNTQRMTRDFTANILIQCLCYNKWLVPYTSQFTNIPYLDRRNGDGVLLKMLSLRIVFASQYYITLGALISGGQCCE